MSTKEGRRTPTPTDVVETSPDRKRLGSKSRLLAPILIGTAIALGGGERNGADAEGVQTPSSETLQTSINSSFDHIDVGLPNIDPNTGEVRGGAWQNLMRTRSEKGDSIEQQSYPDLMDVELMPVSAELKTKYEKMTELMGGKVLRIGQPIRPGDLLDWKSFAGQENIELPAGFLDLYIDILSKMPPGMLRPPNGSPPIFPDFVMLLFNNAQCTCGLNGYFSSVGNEGKAQTHIATLLTVQRGIDLDRGIPHPYIRNSTFGKVAVQRVFSHEIAHTISRGMDGSKGYYDEYTSDVGWYLDPTGPNGWKIREESEVLLTIKDAYKYGPSEAHADMIAYLAVDPTAYLVYPPRHQYHIATNTLFADWDHLWSDPEVAVAREAILKNPPPPLPTNTPTPSPTLPTRTPTLIPSPSPTKPTPESFTVFLPISHTGERVNATPEPEERFGRGSNLSDARRFNPNYENRRNNRKGR